MPRRQASRWDSRSFSERLAARADRWSLARDFVAAWHRPLAPGDGMPEEENAKLSEFALQMVVFETALESKHRASAAWMSRTDLDPAVSVVHPLGFPEWRWPSHPTRFYAGQDALLVAAPNDDDYSVWLGAWNQDALKRLVARSRAAWDVTP